MNKSVFNGFLVVMLVSSTLAGLSFVLGASSAHAATDGWLTANCVVTDGVPRVDLYWLSHPDANSNGLQKGDSYPNDPNRFWEWLPTNDSQRSYTDHNVAFDTTYWYRVKYRPELPSSMDGVAVRCDRPAPPQQRVGLTAQPASGYAPLSVNFQGTLYNALSCGNTYTWIYGDGISETYTEYCFAQGHTVPVRIINGAHAYGYPGTFSAYLIVNGYYSNATTVSVFGQPTPTPTPAPSSLACNPAFQTVSSGQTANFSANGGNGIYTWHAPGANPSVGLSSNFSTSYSVPANSDTTFTVTVESGGFEVRRATCLVRVLGISSPTPTPVPTISPTPSPSPSPVTGAQLIEVRKLGKNITRGQDAEQTALAVSANDTLEFVIHIRSLSNTVLTNVVVTDAMPAGLNYTSRSTSVNGILASDGITGSGINIGSLAPGQEVTVKLNARVHAGTVFPSGSATAINTAQVRSDASPVSVSGQLSISYGQVLGVSIGQVAGVNTGTADTILIALLTAGLVTYGYVRYTGTPLFRRRDALSLFRRHAGKNSGRMDFNRFT